MTKPMLLADFVRLPPVIRAAVVEGLSAAIDTVAERAPEGHRFLRYQWYAAALEAYGGHARTLIVSEDTLPVLALPFVGVGPGWAGFAKIPGCYWPFRSFVANEDAGPAIWGAALDALSGAVNGLRIGPVYDGDASATLLIEAARARGWAVLSRFVADSYRLAIDPADDWPRRSTLRKNRFHEKHLAAHGVLEWQFLTGADWPENFAALGTVEAKSWIADRTDGSDAKFTAEGHLAFWRSTASDPVLAAMMRAALLRVDGVPAAFSFDIDDGGLKYAIANSYDPAFSKHSPGKLLYYRNLIAAMDHGISTVDWGAGDSGYKRIIGAEKGPAIRDWLLVRPGWPARAARLLRIFVARDRNG